MGTEGGDGAVFYVDVRCFSGGRGGGFGGGAGSEGDDVDVC